MSDTSRRSLTPVKGRKIRPPQPRASSHRRTPTPRRSKPSKPIKILQRCSSEPILWTAAPGLILNDEEDRWPNTNILLYRPHTCVDIFKTTSPLSSPASFHDNTEGNYSKDAKVVVNVTVEGSPGPVRAMVRLCSTVEEMIRLVAHRYNEEGRSPLLDGNAASSFELFQSYFSLESIDKTEKIGDVGTRNFYLRKSGSCYSEEVVSSRGNATVSASPVMPLQPFLQFMSFIVPKMVGKISRRTRKLWKILGCIQCG
ncbi:PREDICTED: uncharacterized protein At4g22758-like [Nelumbo nucifera]|uniref:Uncharacterized protein At4g22758-like n=2 Tax=Nelumbo nucifera TaxID=4432 RepID=A0A1U8B672_NELNU|nr:PREDICTED: uncharacterized protein At4g22758-like [Nelumbo nucifera]DAD33737.1 TPA_asm: hypothetical protein HUJ06_012588 [Nelumbo nucifera]